MEFTITGNTIEVRLSKRNLRTLLLKLERETSAKTLYRFSNGKHLFVKAEEDAAHYGDRDPGAVHPKEELLLQSRE